MTQVISVQSQEGQPLMPTKRLNKVWYWLRKGLARLVSREPFTIQLCFETKNYTQEVVLGVDTGSKHVGLAAIANTEVVLQGEVHLRTDIAEKLTQRRMYRRNRRGRKTRYRQARWANRRRPSGWLPPSVRSKCDATLKAVRLVACLLPVSRVHIEIAGFDTQKMQNPEISGLAYQQGELFGYQLREYLLEKWQRKCAYCQKTSIPLQIEHIIPKSREGSDRASNLTLACKACNVRKGTQTASEFGYPEIQKQALLPLTDAAHVSALKTAMVQQMQALFGNEQVQTTFGYETKYQRIQVLSLPKSHTNDAIAIATRLGEVVKPLETVQHLRALGRGQYQRFNGKRSEHKCWSPRKVKGFKLYERVQAKGYQGYIAGRREKGSFVIRDLMTEKKLLEVAPSKLVRQVRPSVGWLRWQSEVGKEGGASSST